MYRSAKFYVVILMLCLGLNLFVIPQDIAQAKSKNIKFVIVGGTEGGQEVSAEAMALNMLVGALYALFKCR
ncbi:MAG: hypothetical protein JRE14_12485 [Deltaproteobacteria bacterium]|nr:hypothetical protein [Deltaproteobacteria bacterium]